MQVLLYHSRPLQPCSINLPDVLRFFGQRELCFDAVSSTCSPSQRLPINSTNDAVSPMSLQIRRFNKSVEDATNDLGPLVKKITPFITRRTLFSALFMYSFCDSSSTNFRGSFGNN